MAYVDIGQRREAIDTGSAGFNGKIKAGSLGAFALHGAGGGNDRPAPPRAAADVDCDRGDAPTGGATRDAGKSFVTADVPQISAIGEAPFGPAALVRSVMGSGFGLGDLPVWLP